MKTGSTLSELCREIERQTATKRDFIADTRSIQVESVDADLVVNFDTQNGLPLTKWGHSQLASVTGIPKAYYDRVRSSSSLLLADQVNHWLHTEPEKKMIRTLDGQVRAIVSDKYRPLDYYDLAEHVLQKINTMGATVESSALTDTKLYLKAVFPKLEGEVKKGDIVQMGIAVSNSEVGNGSVRFEPLIYRLACSNGMILADQRVRKMHIGRAELDLGEFIRSNTRLQMDRAFWMQIGDVVDALFTREFFDRQVEKLRATTEEKITGKLDKVIDATVQLIDGTDQDRGGILQHLAQGGDFTRYGLAQALTRYSQDVDNYEKATDLERAGGTIIELPKNQWQAIAESM